MPIDAHVREAILAQPEPAWTPAIDPSGQVRPSAGVCELTGWIDLHTWPAGTRAICRREDAHPGAQLRFSDHDGHRFQVFLTNQADPDITRLELRPRQRARVEDASAPPRPPGWATSPSTCCAATPSGWSWSWPPKTSPAGPRRCCSTAPSTSPSPDTALPAAARRRPPRPPCPPHDPAAAALLAMGHCSGARVRSAAGPAAALLTRPATPTAYPPTGATPPCPPAAPGTPPARTPAPAAPDSFQNAPQTTRRRPGDRHHALMKSRG
jgi:hypothetical protein